MVNGELVELIRLANGEEIIAEVIGISDIGENLIINEPFSLIAKEVEHQVRVGLGPWVAYKKEGAEVKLNKRAILFRTKVPDQLLKQYLSYVSPIVLPDNNLIVR